MGVSRVLRLFLAAALLAAWQGALVHPLQHVDDHGGLVHLDGKDGKGKADAQCDAIAAVAACVDGGNFITFASPDSGGRTPRVSGQAPRGAAPPAYRSQAPPQHS